MKRTHSERILVYLAEGRKATADEVSRVLGIPDRSARAALGELRRAGLVKKDGLLARPNGYKGPMPELWAWTGAGGVEDIDVDTPADFMPLNPKTPDIREAIASQPDVFHVWAQLMKEAA